MEFRPILFFAWLGLFACSPAILLPAQIGKSAKSLSVIFSSPTVVAGVSSTVTVSFLNNGVVDDSFSGTASLTASDPAAQFSSPVLFTNGVATFPITFFAAGAATLSVNAGTAIALSSLQVLPGAFSPFDSTVTTTLNLLNIGDTATLDLVAKDAYGNAGASGINSLGDIQFLVTAVGGNGTVGAVTDLGSGHYQSIFSATNAGILDIGVQYGNTLAYDAPRILVNGPIGFGQLGTQYRAGSDYSFGTYSVAGNTLTLPSIGAYESTGAYLLINNNSGAPMANIWAESSDPRFVFNGYDVDTGYSGCDVSVILSGSNCLLNVWFVPSGTVGSPSITATVHYTVDGIEGTTPLIIQATSTAAAPLVTLSSASLSSSSSYGDGLDLGTVALDEPISISVRITNNYGSAMNVQGGGGGSSLLAQQKFLMSIGTCSSSIAPGDYCDITLTGSPVSALGSTYTQRFQTTTLNTAVEIPLQFADFTGGLFPVRAQVQVTPIISTSTASYDRYISYKGRLSGGSAKNLTVQFTNQTAFTLPALTAVNATVAPFQDTHSSSSICTMSSLAPGDSCTMDALIFGQNSGNGYSFAGGIFNYFYPHAATTQSSIGGWTSQTETERLSSTSHVFDMGTIDANQQTTYYVALTNASSDNGDVTFEKFISATSRLVFSSTPSGVNPLCVPGLVLAYNNACDLGIAYSPGGKVGEFIQNIEVRYTAVPGGITTPGKFWFTIGGLSQ